MRLTELPQDCDAVITSCAEETSQLSGLGFSPGETVRILARHKTYLILALHQSRYAIDCRISDHITVLPVQNQKTSCTSSI